MIAMAATGAGLGAALFALAWCVLPRRTSALVALARFDAETDGPPAPTPPVAGGIRADPGELLQHWSTRAGTVLARWLGERGISYPHLRQNLALTGRSYENVLALKASAFAAGLLLGSATAGAVQAVLGTGLPFAGAGILALGAGAGLFVLPDLQAHREAAARRRDFRRALASYLDLVALEMAGSAAPAEALPAAARVGAGWPLALLRDTLYTATVSGQDPWEALTTLGERIGVAELRDLGAMVRQSARDGAPIRDTLTARAATMRRRELTDAEGLAGQREQSMRLAQILIGMAFIALLLYPALVNVLAV